MLAGHHGEGGGQCERANILRSLHMAVMRVAITGAQ